MARWTAPAPRQRLARPQPPPPSDLSCSARRKLWKAGQPARIIAPLFLATAISISLVHNRQGSSTTTRTLLVQARWQQIQKHSHEDHLALAPPKKKSKKGRRSDFQIAPHRCAASCICGPLGPWHGRPACVDRDGVFTRSSPLTAAPALATGGVRSRSAAQHGARQQSSSAWQPIVFFFSIIISGTHRSDKQVSCVVSSFPGPGSTTTTSAAAASLRRFCSFFFGFGCAPVRLVRRGLYYAPQLVRLSSRDSDDGYVCTSTLLYSVCLYIEELSDSRFLIASREIRIIQRSLGLPGHPSGDPERDDRKPQGWAWLRAMQPGSGPCCGRTGLGLARRGAGEGAADTPLPLRQFVVVVAAALMKTIS